MAGFKGLFPSCLSLPVKCVARKEATAGRAAGLPGGAVFPGELTYWQERGLSPSPRRGGLLCGWHWVCSFLPILQKYWSRDFCA